MYTCEVCLKEYVRASGLNKHLRQTHSKNTRVEYHCFDCHEIFSNKGKLITHLKVHQGNFRGRNKRLRCSFIKCNTTCVSYLQLQQHLREEHNFHLDEQKLEFATKTEFLEWKKNAEDANNVMYVKDGGMKLLKNGSEVNYFVCHRSYSKRTGEKDHLKRLSKNIGTNKIGRACPSRLIVTYCTNKYYVTFYSSHAGHDCEIGRVRLNSEDRNILAGKLSEGVPMQRILSDIREEDVNDLKRIHLLEKKDLHNIVRDFSLEYATKRHENDAVSVKLWVEEVKQNKENPIVYYKEQQAPDPIFKNEDFVLIIMTDFQQQVLKQFGSDKICIDGTHGLNKYDFQLYSIVVVDEYGNGVPAAFCFSNRADEELFKFFFLSIKQLVGTITANTFMSDDAPAFYNAWEFVMAPVLNRLLCSWHINRNWMTALNKLVCSDKKSIVFQTLQVLRSETDIHKFHTELSSFLNYLKSDIDTCRFCEYFQSYYVNRVEQWAYCFRIHLGINTNMFLEAFHKKIKYCYLDGKQCKRLDKSINALMNLLRDSMFERIIKLCKNKSTYKIEKIRNSHVKSRLITSLMVSPFEEENSWLVNSSKDTGHKYIVKKVLENCLQLCALMCTECKICVHMFKCSCNDNLIYFNICKHIHACAKLYSIGPIHDNARNNGQDQMVALLAAKEDRSGSCSNTSNFYKKQIQGKLDLILGLNQKVNLDESEFQSVAKKLDSVISYMHNIPNFTSDSGNTNHVNTKKNLQPQRRLFSTKKKRKGHVKINVASQIQKNVIKEALLEGSDNVLYVHDSFDHTYTKM